MTLTLRRYEPDDCAACWLVFYRAVQIGAARFYNQAQRDIWCAAQPAATPERNARLADAITWVAESSGKLVGFMSLKTDGHLDMAFVDPDHMGQGVAVALHHNLIQSARNAGITQLHTKASHLARRFFLRQGWQVVRPETVQRDGVSLPRFVMQITLEE